MEPIVIVHGGAGEIGDSRVPGKFIGIINAAKTGYKSLEDGGSVLDAVEAAIRVMEEDSNFNAGYGAVLNYDGNIELDASIMHGKNLEAGCVTLLKDIMHPISVARRVMEKTKHNFIGGDKANYFARRENFEILPEGSLVTDSAKMALEEFKKKEQQGIDTTFSCTELDSVSKTKNETETVGAVAMDRNGNIAAATSTGGLTGKMPGRIGDTPILGSGTYADNLIGGVSTTGHGETIMKFNLAQRILQKICSDNVSAQEATEDVIKTMTARLTGTAGAITIDKNGSIGVYFSSPRMAWAYMKKQELHYGINPGEDLIENIN